jgi:hypothetical protein
MKLLSYALVLILALTACNQTDTTKNEIKDNTTNNVSNVSYENNGEAIGQEYSGKGNFTKGTDMEKRAILIEKLTKKGYDLYNNAFGYYPYWSDKTTVQFVVNDPNNTNTAYNNTEDMEGILEKVTKEDWELLLKEDKWWNGLEWTNNDQFVFVTYINNK